MSCWQWAAGEKRVCHLQVFDGTAWTCRAALPAPRWAAASVATRGGGRLLVLGGTTLRRADEGDGDGSDDDDDDEAHTASAIEYDPHTDRWEAAAPLPAPDGACAATAHAGGAVVVVGGFGGPPWRRHRDGKTWSELPRFPGAERYRTPSVASLVLG